MRTFFQSNLALLSCLFLMFFFKSVLASEKDFFFATPYFLSNGFFDSGKRKETILFSFFSLKETNKIDTDILEADSFSRDASEKSFQSPTAGVALKTEGLNWLLSGNFSIPLTSQLENAVFHGIALFFELQFELRRTRWWWRDEIIDKKSLSYKLSYHPLTRQFRVNRGGISQSFDSLSDAVTVISRVRDWIVFSSKQLKPTSSYRVSVRLNLNSEKLPKPFQISAITDHDWNPPSEWMHLFFTFPE